jgi:hypothetical protein
MSNPTVVRSLSVKIDTMIRQLKPIDFTDWINTDSLKYIVALYESELGKSEIVTNNAKNLVYSLRAYHKYTNDNTIRDYIVFMEDIIENQLL